MRILILAGTRMAPVITNAYNYGINKGHEVICLNGSKTDKVFTSLSDFNYFQNIDYIIDLIKNYDIEGVLCLTTERTILRDGKLSSKLRELGIKVIANPEETMDICFDKIKTREFLLRNGFDVPRGFNFNNNSSLQNVAENLNFPVVVKEPIASGGTGNQFIKNLNELEEFFSKPFKTENYVVEEFIEGEELSVEVLGQADNLSCSTPLFKGKTEFNTHALDRLRICPYFDYELNHAIQEYCIKISKALRVNGVIEIEMVWNSKLEKLFVLEINPRLGGTTALNRAYSGVEVSHELIDLLDGTWEVKNPLLPLDHYAIEIKVTKNISTVNIDQFNKLTTVKRFTPRKRPDSDGVLIMAGSEYKIIEDLNLIRSLILNYEEVVGHLSKVNV